jgi:hypothetical protein
MGWFPVRRIDVVVVERPKTLIGFMRPYADVSEAFTMNIGSGKAVK